MYLPILAPGTKSMTHMGIVDDWADVFNNISTCRYEDAVLGILCCILLLLLRVSFSKQTYVKICVLHGRTHDNWSTLEVQASIGSNHVRMKD
jgi:hypothetical protein